MKDDKFIFTSKPDIGVFHWMADQLSFPQLVWKLKSASKMFVQYPAIEGNNLGGVYKQTETVMLSSATFYKITLS